MTTVCILAAGKGSRLCDYSDFIHKCLLPLGEKPVLTRIIEKFPQSTRFIIAVHHRATQIQDYLNSAHPDLNVKFVYVQSIEGPQAGPGYSLMQCRDYLQTPFYLVCSDTIWNQQFKDLVSLEHTNWIGCSNIESKFQKNFCNLTIDENQNITGVYDKKEAGALNTLAFVGLAYIRTPEAFFNNFQYDPINGEIQISNGFQSLLKYEVVRAVPIDWIDTGNIENYKAAASKYSLQDKQDEFTYFVNGRVIKFFCDEAIALARLNRGLLRPDIFPENIERSGQFLSYVYKDGHNLYSKLNAQRFSDFLFWMDNSVWELDLQKTQDFQSKCRDFYIGRANNRLNLFEKRFGTSWFSEAKIDKVYSKDPRSLLSMLTSFHFRESQPSFFHGDLTLANIIDCDQGSFALVDWRQDFAGSLSKGDICLDFAKLMISLKYNLEECLSARHPLWVVDEQGYCLNVPSTEDAELLLHILRNFVVSKGISWEYIELCASLSLLAMAGIHKGPVAITYFLLGTRDLNAYMDLNTTTRDQLDHYL